MSMRHASARRRTRPVVLLCALALTLFVTSGVAWAYHDLNSNIQAVEVEDLLGEERPEAPEPVDPTDPNAGQALNVLLVGTDDRSGDNEDIGGTTTDGIRSDTMIVAHISADRERVEMISVPRDSWVTIPACELPDGSLSSPREGKINGAFEIGGASGDLRYAAACTIRTLESLTDVRIDGFMAVDFGGFVDVVDALGGVPFCVPEPVDDRRARLQLDAGEQVLDGTQALGYARVRMTLGDGSDTQRIERQQALLGATVRHALDQNLLTDAPKLYAFLDAVTSAFTASSDFASISHLSGLAYSLRGIDPADVAFTTVPWVDRDDGANVLWTAEAQELWERVARDEPLAVDDAEGDAGQDGPDGEGQAGGTDDDADGEPTSPTEDSSGPTLDGSTAEDQDATCG